MPTDPTALDLIEQQERINNFNADTAAKLQGMRIARAQLFIAFATVIVAFGGVVLGALTLYYDHRATPKPEPSYIFLNPSCDKVL
jgi:hypothetical protein